jgi:hypothetical protein
MPVDPSIALGVKPAQFDNPLAVAMQMQQFARHSRKVRPRSRSSGASWPNSVNARR